MDEKQYKELVEKIGKEAADKIAADMKTVEKNLNDKFEAVMKGTLKMEDWEAFKNDEMTKLKDSMKGLEDALKEQGTVLAAIKEQGADNKPKTLDDVFSNKELIDQIKNIYKQGVGNVEIDLKALGVTTIGKTAGSTSIGNVVQPMSAPPNSPYLPSAAPLDATNFFGIIYNPNFIINYVNRGRTNFSRLPWVNETSVEGAAAAVQEGAAKPLWNTRFKVEMSTAKKIAAMSTITEEFDQDLPGFTTIVQRLLTEEVSRKWDDAVYAAVILAATGYTITGLNGQVDDSNLYDVLRSGIAQIGKNNYSANFIGINPVTFALVEMQKSATDRLYLLPPFLQRIYPIMHEGNKVAENYALVGDILQYNVDVYKDLVLKVGWNADDFQRNQFSVIAEVRYHDYISDNRKPALAYFNMNTVRTQIDSGS